MAQINELLAEKAARTPAQRKISSQLIYAAKRSRRQPIGASVKTLQVDLPMSADRRVELDVRAEVSEALLHQLRGLGAEVIDADAGHRSVTLTVELDRVEAIAGLPDVVTVRPKVAAATSRWRGSATGAVESRARPRGSSTRFDRATLERILRSAVERQQASSPGTNAGSVDSQGDATHQAASARATHSVNGAGVKIGVLSDGVCSLAASQARGDLGTVTVHPGQTGTCPGADEGTAMLEIIHDLAPGAELYFATAFTSITSFADNIRSLRTTYGCDIIVDDVFYFNEEPFQDGQAPSLVSPGNAGVVKQAVKDVTAAGALYFSAAGNEGNLDSGTSGVWEGDFLDAGPVGPPIASIQSGRLHNFGAQTWDVMTSMGYGNVLEWADPLGDSANDYDLFELRSDGSSVVRYSNDVQDGTQAQDPYEFISSACDVNNPPPCPAAGDRLVIVKFSGADRFLHLGTLRGRLSIATSGAIFGHSAVNSANAFGVAATPAVGPYPSPFSGSNHVETFSSDGYRRIFFNADGSAITPGNFSSTGGQVLSKPDLTAADGVATGVTGFETFYGTSAAAPHAAAIAALVKSANLSLTAAQIRTALIDSALDIHAVGADRDSGAGIVMADTAVAGVAVTTTVSPSALVFAATKNGAGGALAAVTPAQTVSVSFSAPAAAWTVTAGQPWVGVTGGSGTGSGMFSVSIINPGNVLGASTNVSTTVTLNVPSLNFTRAIPVQLTVQLTTTASAAPYGVIDTPVTGATGVVGSLGVTGWALDDVGVNRVTIWRNCVEAIDRPAGACMAAVPGGPGNLVYIGDGVFLSGARPDVEVLNPGVPEAYRAGWGYMMLTNALPHVANGTANGGQGTFTLSAYAVDMEGYSTSLGTKTITLDNDHATIPFGAIDTPEQGGTMTAAVYQNFGWAMTQPGKCIDTTTTASYRVYIDGVSRTLTASGAGDNWDPGLLRPDIAAAYPGYCNTNNALAAYFIDATALGLSNGQHTIGWDVIDSGGNVAGIGSRFFNVLVGGTTAAFSSGTGRPMALGQATDLAGFAPSPRGVRIVANDVSIDRPGGPERAALRSPDEPAAGDDNPSHDGRSAALSGPRSGASQVQLPLGGRIALDLSGPVEAGYQIVGDELRPLPAGSTFDAAGGRFSWQPPTPFLGAFRLVFTGGGERQDVVATIIDPTADSAVKVHIDLVDRSAALSGPRSEGGPERAALRSMVPFVIAGWAFDPQAAIGSGIDTLHVWAYRRDVAGVPPQFLGAAVVGGARPDVAAAFGAQFDTSGWTLTADGLPLGSYDLLVYPWSHRTGRFEDAGRTTIAVR